MPQISIRSATRRHPPLRIGPVVATRHGDATGVEAVVDGTPVWFRSEDVALRASPEAFGCAMLIPSLLARRRLEVSDPVDPAWLDNIGSVPTVVGRWWDIAQKRPKVRRAAAATTPAGSGRALCFTCGVDSFHALEQTGFDPGTLVLALGYDIALDDAPRAADLVERTRAVAAHRGLNSIVISTNVRSHPSFAGTNWEQTHGGALAALGHLLAEHVNVLGIASSFPRSHARPWGSRWDLDPLWSSSAVAIQHLGDDLRREDKIAALDDDSLAWQHLQVCWEHRTATGNCGTCDKCVVTAVGLAAAGRRAPDLPGGRDLLDAIDTLRATRYLNSYERMLEGDVIPPGLRAPASALLARSSPG
jgi:hypothetical protein